MAFGFALKQYNVQYKVEHVSMIFYYNSQM